MIRLQQSEYQYMKGQDNKSQQTSFFTKQSEAFKICKYCSKHFKNTEFILHQIKCKIMKKMRKPKQSQNKQIKPINKNQPIQLLQIPQEKIPCTYCGYMQTLKELDVHPLECAFHKNACPFCDQPYPSQLMQQHIQICQKQHQNQQKLLQQQDQQFRIIQYLKVGKQKEMCSVCYKPFQFKKQFIVFKCLHLFHPQCIYPWFQQDNFNCFLCKN